MLTEELGCIGITAQLHVPQLQPGPIGVQVCTSHKGDMHTEIAVHGRAINADEHAIGDTGPGRILGSTVEAGLEGEI